MSAKLTMVLVTPEITGEPEKRLSGFGAQLQRMVGVRAAADVLGHGELAEAMGIGPRALRAKLGAERGISDADLLAVCAALETQAATMLSRAQRLRGLCRDDGYRGGEDE